MSNVIKKYHAQNLKTGMRDRNGLVVTNVDGTGWYATADGKIRDPEGYEWMGDENNGGGMKETDTAVIAKDDRAGQRIVIRDIKIAMMPGAKIDPKQFIEHHRPMIEEMMVETGWDYADDKSMEFGEAKDGYVHIYVHMKKKNWKNKENAYAGIKHGQGTKTKSKALVKAGAVDPYIHGGSVEEKHGEDLLK